jgi:hypothetical protein
MLRQMKSALLLAAVMVACSGAAAQATGTRGDRTLFGGGRTLRFFGLTQDLKLARFGECGPNRLQQIGISGVSAPDTTLIGIAYCAKSQVAGS